MDLFISAFILVVVMIFLYWLKFKEINFSLRILVGLGLGVVAGIIFKEKISYVQYVGTIYISFIKMLVIPLVIVSLIGSITNLKDGEKLKSLGIKTIFFLLLTTAIATMVGIIIGKVFNVGSGMNYIVAEGFKAREIPNFNTVLMDMLPTNPIQSMAEGKIIPVIIFSLFIAIAMVIEGNIYPEKIKPFKDFITSLNVILVRVTRIILNFTPYGVFALMAKLSAENGISTLLPLGTMIVAVYVACIIQIGVVYSGLILAIKKKNPIHFFKAISPAQIVAFTTQSSYGALPVTIKSLVERANIPEEVASFVAPLGSTIGMNGCGGIYPAIVAIFVANVFGIDLTMTHYGLLVVTTVISSIGIAGVPGAATMSTTVVLASLGLPIEGLAMVIGVDAIIDMIRTMTNVTGSSVVALLVSEE
ncbi:MULTISPECIES: dicarboxylate/amino acid:cation symporter [Clostridium]|uniref:Dicarboxylate/amino acid:cation symporter n=1 Tax=Clostridium senegalense TaxID=1465809 RepID=A0A6M0H3H6_9CLOT|nr:MULTISPECIES: dicarboxylate/amino acid:cation symporter [Clostridium]NEU04623.1 dicarboxylate/amino acid:cation symporter [Clostridium senegalense]